MISAARVCFCVLLPATTLPASGAAVSPAAPAQPSTPAPSHTFSSSPSQPFIPWNQNVINSSPWDQGDLDLLDRDPRQRWVKRLDENPLAGRYLPPSPPALAETLTPHVSPFPARLPNGLLDFTSETFYMAYGQMLQSRSLSEDRVQRISRYRAARDRLVAEIRTLVEQTKDLPEPRRTVALREFSSAQSPRAASLENEVEAIRTDLTSPGFFRFGASAYDLARSADWSRDDHRPDSFAYIIPLLGAQFYAGFSADQRLLLHEMTIEQRADVLPSPSASNPARPGYLFFLPSTSRIKLPAHPSPSLDDKVRRFRTQKEALKAELQNALDRDQFKFVGPRTERFAQLARAQAPRFSALHALAEDIRAELASIQYPDAPSGPSLPGDMIERVGHATTRKAALQRELITRFKALQTQLPGERVEIIRRGKGLALLTARPPGSRLAHDKREQILTEIAAFNDSIGQRYVELAREMDTLRRDLRAIAPTRDQSSSTDIDRLAAEFDRSYKKQETWNRYRDYHAAVLASGLSPELRRLLYRAAWADLFKHQVLASP